MRKLVTLAVALLLGACAQEVSTNVSQFHQLAQPGGETVKIVPMGNVRDTSLEFETYAGYVRQRLVENGYEPVAADPDIRIEMGYRVSDPRTFVEDRGGFYGYGGYGFGYPGFGFAGYPWWGWGYGFGYPYGFAGDRIDSYDLYDRHLAVDMINTRTGEVVYEGRVVSRGRNPNMPEVMPYLVEAMFTDFPGQSGETQRIDVKVQEGDERTDMAQRGY